MNSTPAESAETLVSFDDVYEAQYRRLLALAHAATGNWQSAEDLTQETFLRALRHWHKIAQYDDPGAWLRRVLINRVASRWRGLGREQLAFGRWVSRSPEEASDQSMHDAAFWSAVRRLSPQQRRVVLLHYVDDLDVEQIARVLECSAGTVKTHLHRARTQLAVLLTEGGNNV